MSRVEKECPRCKGERGFWRKLDNKAPFAGVWHPCIMCKTQGTVKVASMSEFRRLEHSVTHPKKVGTKQREKERDS